MSKINYTRPKLFPYQAAIIDSSARFTVTEASTKVGKTASHIVWLLEQALRCKKGQSVWWVAPVYAQAKIAFSRMKLQVTAKNFFKANESELTLTLPHGSIIVFKSAEKPDNLYGDDVYAAVFDEFTRSREEAWFALRSTLSSTGGPCKFIGNVKGKKNWGYKLAQRAKHGEPNHAYFKITAYDAAEAGMLTKDGRPFIEEIEQAKRDLPDYVFKELYLAEPSDDAANPFGLSFIQQCTYPMSNEPAICYGVDVARSNDFTVIIGLDKNCQVCYLDRFQRDWRQTTQAILNLPNVPIAIDGTGVGSPIGEEVARLKDVEIVIFTQHSKQQLMEALSLAIQQRRIAFPEGVITDELNNFEYEYTRTGVRYSAPAGMHDDAVCALALALKKWRAGGSGNYSFI
jgi:phage FluMu gp28-like protein